MRWSWVVPQAPRQTVKSKPNKRRCRAAGMMLSDWQNLVSLAKKKIPPPGLMDTDFLIIGQGLAGTVLALELIDAGKRVLVVDDGHRSAASRAAAGIINPVTGKRLAPSWRVDVLLPASFAYYREWERRYGAAVLHARTVRRYLTPEQRRRHWPRRLASGELTRFLAGDSTSPEAEAVEFRPAGYVDTETFLAVSAAFLAERKALVCEAFAYADIRVEKASVRWKNVRAGKIIFCEGYKAAGNPFFDWLPFTPAKGEILTFNAPSIAADRIVNDGKWLLPLGDGRVRVGATYEWDRLDETPTDVGRRELERACASLAGGAPAEIIDHRAGVRSILKDTKPVLGLHPGHDTVGIFNGLGSKGVMVAPHFARQFTEYLVKGRTLDDEVDVRRNF